MCVCVCVSVRDRVPPNYFLYNPMSKLYLPIMLSALNVPEGERPQSSKYSGPRAKMVPLQA